MARVSVTMRLLHLALLGALCVYLTLPYWGTAWHSLVPEHEHFWLGPGSHDTLPGQDACALCLTPPVGETVVHAFNPVSAVQFLSLMLGLAVFLLLFVPEGIPTRFHPLSLFLRSPLLVPLDPPPVR